MKTGPYDYKLVNPTLENDGEGTYGPKRYYDEGHNAILTEWDIFGVDDDGRSYFRQREKFK